MAAPLANRMQVKPGHRILAVNAPGVATDLTRDRGWEAVADQIDAVSQVAVDDTWSALRFKAVAEAGRRGERRRPAAAS